MESGTLNIHHSFGGGAGGIGQPMFSLYLKASKHPKYTVSQINTYPTTTAAVMVVAELLYSWISDGPLRGKRWPVMVFAAVCRVDHDQFHPVTNNHSSSSRSSGFRS